MTFKKLFPCTLLVLLAAAPALAQEAVAPPPCACPCPCPEPPPPPLQGSLSAGLSITSGNTDTSAFNVAFNLVYDPKTHGVFKADAFYLRSTTNGDATTDKAAASLRYEYGLTDRIYAFGQLGYQRDQFKNVVYLFTPMAGGGYYFMKQKNLELGGDVSIGGAFEKDSGYDPSNSGAFSVGAGFPLEDLSARDVHREGERPLENEPRLGRLLPLRDGHRGLDHEVFRAEDHVPRRRQERTESGHAQENRHGAHRGLRLQVLTDTGSMLPGRQAKDINADDVVLGLDAAAIRRSFVEKLFFEVAKFPGVATRNDHYLALARAVRDRILHRWIRSARTYLEEQHRTVIYLSAEYLMGPQLGNNLFNLGIEGPARQAMESLGLDLDELIEHEEEPGLGNGGLGRLAACFMDSLATLDFPAIGHGIRYEFGIFDQEIRDGWQVERTDRWLRLGNPWEVRRYEIEHTVGFGGRTEIVVDAAGRSRVKWIPARVVRGVPYDTPVVGYGTVTTNFLRLWAAVAAEEFDLDAFQVGEYWRAVDEKIRSENITKVALPERRLDGRQAAAARAGVLLRVLRAAGLHPPAAPAHDHRQVRREVRGPAQRHPPDARGSRADAPPHGRAWPGLGRGVVHRLAAPSTTRTTRSCPRRSRRGRSRSSRACCRGTSRSSTRSTGASSTRCARASPATTGGSRGSASSTNGAKRACAWRTSRRSRAGK